MSGFYISETAAPTALKLGVLFGADRKGGLQILVSVSYICTRTCASAHPALYLRNGLVDRVQIRCVVRDSLVTSFRHGLDTSAHAHMHAAHPFFNISGMAGWIVLKYLW